MVFQTFTRIQTYIVMNKSRFFSFLFPFLILLSTVSIGFFFFLQKSGPRDYQEIAKEGVLRVVTEYNQSGYYVSGDTIQGFQYDLLKAISTVSGIQLEIFLEMGLPESFDGLTNQQYDIVARNIPITSELKNEYAFTDHIVLNKQVLVQRTEEANAGVQPIRNQLELSGKTLHVPENSPAILRIRNFQHEIADSIYIVEDAQYSTEQLIIMVAKGEIDYAVCDLQLTLKYADSFPEIDFRTDIGFTQLEAWALRKDSPALLDSLNHWLGVIRASGVYDKIYANYFK